MKIKDFDAFISAKGVECLGNDCHISYSGKGVSGSSAIDVATRKSSSGIKIDVGAIDPEKEYVLRMKLSTKEKLTANLSLRHKGHPWSGLSESYPVRLAATTNSVEKFFSFPDEAQEGVVIFTIEDGQSHFSINEIEWAEAKLEVHVPKFLFLYNSRQVPESINLSGVHTDAYHNEMQEAVLPPFSSVILFPKVGPDR